MVFCTNAFATPINLSNSTESVVTDTLDKTNGTDYFTDETTTLDIWYSGSGQPVINGSSEPEKLYFGMILKKNMKNL